METLMILLPIIAFSVVWFCVARFYKTKGKGVVLRHLIGFMIGALVLIITAIFVAPTSDRSSQVDGMNTLESTKQVDKKKRFENLIGKDIEYNVNEKGVLIFAKARDMFSSFNDYREEEGEIAFLSENPLSLKINKHLTAGDPNLREYSEMSFLYAIYRTFMNTSLNEITVEAYPISINDKTNQKIEHKQYIFTATVSREKALEVLKKYTSATSFDDLVQTSENSQHRTVGISGSEIWDKFIYNEKQRSQIVSDLMK